ncbi:alpha/beta fold hydrolase [Halosquirtibacter xylanolyticus]|uniref:alpha/beta hydrolase n=1 Tax=Halosquirtibacter xylanolyticus TaxID=3374599 RepID=UPI00374A26C3|nr:alpha/beta fold hydrolase [Prolixibacteraceae bacterium]
MKKLSTLLSIFLICTSTYSVVASDTVLDQEVVVSSKQMKIYGSLMTPKEQTKIAALIIAGSGPTDRNGNSKFTQTNCLLQLAQSLADHNIASLRYDKRGIGRSTFNLVDENLLRFDQFVDDAVACIQYLKKKKFTHIIVIGHSQGALIGTLAIQKEEASSLISLCGPGKPGDKIIEEQLRSMPQQDLTNQAIPILNLLQSGQKASNIPIPLRAIFRPSVQPFLISWFQYDPCEEIKKVSIPILIIAGKQDLQIPLYDAKLLHKANKTSKLVIINKMNHVLKEVGNDIKENRASYSDPLLPISKELIEKIDQFVNHNP